MLCFLLHFKFILRTNNTLTIHICTALIAELVTLCTVIAEYYFWYFWCINLLSSCKTSYKYTCCTNLSVNFMKFSVNRQKSLIITPSVLPAHTLTPPCPKIGLRKILFLLFWAHVQILLRNVGYHAEELRYKLMDMTGRLPKWRRQRLGRRSRDDKVTVQVTWPPRRALHNSRRSMLASETAQ